MSLDSFRIGKKVVGKDFPSYIIAEIGSNFDGSLSKAKKLIKLAKQSGADAAKFQSFHTELLLSKKGFEKNNSFQSKWKSSVWETYKNAELPRQWHKKLNDYAKKLGIHFFTSPWDFEAVDLLCALKVPAIKIGSGDITYHELLKYIGSKQKPILLATGASNLNEVKDAINVIKSTGNNKIILMHSVVQYPSDVSDANLNVLALLKQKFKLNVGYSDHSPGSLVALASVSLGATVIEKHFTIDSNLVGPDHPHSMNPTSFKEMVVQIRMIEKALGNGIKKPVHSEKITRVLQRRGVWTIKKISKGEKFDRDNIRALRPAIGIPASHFHKLLGKRAKKDFTSFEAL